MQCLDQPMIRQILGIYSLTLCIAVQWSRFLEPENSGWAGLRPGQWHLPAQVLWAQNNQRSPCSWQRPRTSRYLRAHDNPNIYTKASTRQSAKKKRFRLTWTPRTMTHWPKYTFKLAKSLNIEFCPATSTMKREGNGPQNVSLDNWMCLATAWNSHAQGALQAKL